MNISILSSISVDPRVALLEVHEEFTFRNSPKRYEYARAYYHSFKFLNIINGERVYRVSLIFMKEMHWSKWYGLHEVYAMEIRWACPISIKFPLDIHKISTKLETSWKLHINLMEMGHVHQISIA